MWSPTKNAENGIQRGMIRGALLVVAGVPFLVVAGIVEPLDESNSGWPGLVALPGLIAIPAGLLMIAFFASVWLVKVGIAAGRS